MLRNLHFFNIKDGADEKRMLSIWDNEVAAWTKGFGCIERKTWKLLDARSQGQPVEAAAYMNEALWPSHAATEEMHQAEMPDETKKVRDELLGGIEIVKTVRYIDEQG